MRFKKFNIDAYVPGKSSVNNLKKVIKLSANESALGMSSKAVSYTHLTLPTKA